MAVKQQTVYICDRCSKQYPPPDRPSEVLVCCPCCNRDVCQAVCAPRQATPLRSGFPDEGLCLDCLARLPEFIKSGPWLETVLNRFREGSDEPELAALWTALGKKVLVIGSYYDECSFVEGFDRTPQAATWISLQLHGQNFQGQDAGVEGVLVDGKLWDHLATVKVSLRPRNMKRKEDEKHG